MNNFEFQQFISSILSDVEKFAEFNGTIFLNLSKNGGDIDRKLTDAWPSRIDGHRPYSPLVGI